MFVLHDEQFDWVRSVGTDVEFCMRLDRHEVTLGTAGALSDR